MFESHLRRSWLLPGLSYLRLVHVSFYISFSCCLNIVQRFFWGVQFCTAYVGTASQPSWLTVAGASLSCTQSNATRGPCGSDWGLMLAGEIMFLFSYRNPLSRSSFDAFFDWLLPGNFRSIFSLQEHLRNDASLVLSWRVAKLRHAKCKHWFGDHCLRMGWTWPCMNWEFWLQRLFWYPNKSTRRQRTFKSFVVF